MSETATRKKPVDELIVDLEKLVEWAATVSKEEKGFHPDADGRLEPVAEYNKLLNEAKGVIPGIRSPEISWQLPPTQDGLFNERCLSKWREVNREAMVLLHELSYHESLRRCIDKSQQTIQQADENRSKGESAMQRRSWDEAIHRYQLCMEFCAKAMFSLVGLPQPRVHEITSNGLDWILRNIEKRKIQDVARPHKMEDIIDRLEALDDFGRRCLARLYWMNSTWSLTHIIADYGCLGVRASSLFEETDAKMAQTYALEALSKARHILYHVQTRTLAVKREALVLQKGSAAEKPPEARSADPLA